MLLRNGSFPSCATFITVIAGINMCVSGAPQGHMSDCGAHTYLPDVL